jgi:hypothetical protein
MTHHLIDVPTNFLSQTKNIILIRDPMQVLISYAKVIEQPTLADIGIRQSFDLFHFLKEKNYHVMAVDSNDLLKNPEKMLSAVCEQLGIGFQLRCFIGKQEPDQRMVCGQSTGMRMCIDRQVLHRLKCRKKFCLNDLMKFTSRQGVFMNPFPAKRSASEQ